MALFSDLSWKDVVLCAIAVYVSIKAVKSVIRWRNPKHDLPYIGPFRSKPDERFFPMYMKNRQGLWLYWRCWRVPPNVPVKGVVYFCEGMGDNSARYETWANFFNPAGYHCYIVDHQGQSLSEGERKYFERFSHFLDDFEDFVSFTQGRHSDLKGLPKLLIGHSLGGLIAALLAQRRKDLFSGVVLTAPALYVDDKAAPGWMRALAKTLGSVVPKFALSTNAHVVKFTRNDDLMKCCELDYINTMNIPMACRAGAEFLQAQDDAMHQAPAMTTPFLIMHGEKDILTPIIGSRKFFAASGSVDKTLKEYPNLYHDFFFDDQEHAQTEKDVLEWMDKHLK